MWSIFRLFFLFGFHLIVAQQTVERFTLIIRKETLLGHNKLQITVNHTVPGPAIYVNQGNQIEITVINEIFDDSTSIHFHGINQYATPWNDGVVGITQCPLTNIFGSNVMVYNFTAVNPGTYWYHSHFDNQYAEGLYGAFVVRDEEDISFETNVQEAILTISDYYNSKKELPITTPPMHEKPNKRSLYEYHNALHSSERDRHNSHHNDHDNDRDHDHNTDKDNKGPDRGRDQRPSKAQDPPEDLPSSPPVSSPVDPPEDRPKRDNPTPRDYFPLPDHFVVNNVLNGHYSLQEIARDKPLLLRLINTGIQASYIVSIEGLPMKIMEVDGCKVEPFFVSNLTIAIGQRINVLLDWKYFQQPLYWNSNSIKIHFHAKLNRYIENNKGEYIQHEPFKLLSSQFTALIAFKSTSNVDSSSTNTTLTPLIITPKEPNLMQARPRHTHSLQSYTARDYSHPTSFIQLNLSMQSDASEELGPHHPPLTGINNAGFNLRGFFSFDMPKPILYEIMAQSSNNSDSPFHRSHNPDRIYGSGKRPFVIPYNVCVEVTLYGSCCEEHPFHFHGHHIAIVSSSLYPEAEQQYQGNYLPRDVVIVPAGGWIKVRFYSDNPGVWIMHCHIQSHFEAGMGAVIIEAPNQLMQLYQNELDNPIPESHRTLCRHHIPYSQLVSIWFTILLILCLSFCFVLFAYFYRPIKTLTFSGHSFDSNSHSEGGIAMTNLRNGNSSEDPMNESQSNGLFNRMFNKHHNHQTYVRLNSEEDDHIPHDSLSFESSSTTGDVCPKYPQTCRGKPLHYPNAMKNTPLGQDHIPSIGDFVVNPTNSHIQNSLIQTPRMYRSIGEASQQNQNNSYNHNKLQQDEEDYHSDDNDDDLVVHSLNFFSKPKSNPPKRTYSHNSVHNSDDESVDADEFHSYRPRSLGCQ